MALEDLMNTADIASSNPLLKEFTSILEQIMSIPEESLTETNIEVVSGMINGALQTSIKEESIKAFIDGLREGNFTKKQATATIIDLKDGLKEIIENLKPSELRRQLLTSVCDAITAIFDEALDRYESYDIVLPISLEEGAVVPSYAHETDAAADLYAKEDTEVPAGTRGMLVHTGVHIGLPDGWVAYVVPRSSTGMKTPLRQSNSFGVIDAHYRGEIGLLFDNISNLDYHIKKGDRLAQMFIMPVYRFKPDVVEKLDDTDRGTGGFGSTGV